MPGADFSPFICGFQDSISLLLEAVRTKNEELAQTWKKSEQWATIEQLCSKKGGSGPCPLTPRARGWWEGAVGSISAPSGAGGAGLGSLWGFWRSVWGG